MTDIASLGIRIDTSGVSSATGEMRKLQITSEHLEQSAGKLSNAFMALRGVLATLGVGVSLNAIYANTIEAEQAALLLSQRLDATGNAVGFTAEELKKMAGELQKTTTFGDDAIIRMQTSMLKFGNISGEVFKRAQKSVLDLAADMGTSPIMAARMLGMALEDPARGLLRLRLQGIVFSQAQQDVIKKLVETGQVSKAQIMILDELDKKLGGTAEAMRGTLGGAITALGEAFGDLLEMDKNVTEPVRKGIETLTANLSVLADTAVLLASIGLARWFASLATSVSGAVKDLWTYVTVTRAAQVAELESARTALAAATARATLTGATDAVAAATARYTAAQAALAGPASKVLRILGGWPGVLSMAAAALFTWIFQVRDAKVEFRDFTSELEAFKAAGSDWRKTTKVTGAIIALEKQIKSLESELESTVGLWEVLTNPGRRNEIARQLAESRAQLRAFNEELERRHKLEASETLSRNEVRNEEEIGKILGELKERAEVAGLSASDALARQLKRLGATATEVKAALRDLATEQAKLEQEALQADFTSSLTALNRELYLLGKNTREAQISWDLYYGTLRKLTPVQKQQLLTIAAFLDLQDEEARFLAERHEKELKHEIEVANAAAEANAILLSIDPVARANAEWQKLLDLQRILGDEFPLTAEQMVQAYKQATKGIIDETENATDQMTIFAEQAGRNIQDAFADFLFDPFKKGVDGMLEEFTVMLRRMAAQAMASQILGSLGAWGKTGGGAGTFIGDVVGAVFGGGKANGGMVAVGTSYLVGERGPEIFIPRQSGEIIPNNKLGSRLGSVTVVNNFTISQPTDRRTQEQIANLAGASIQRAMARGG